MSAWIVAPTDVMRREVEACVTPGEPSACWEWQGWRNRKGYGIARVKLGKPERRTSGSRAAYIIAHGGIAPGLVVRHSCDNPPCCNPAHLIAGTTAENQRDKADRGRAARGSGASSAKLSEQSVREIRRTAAGGTPQVQIAAQYGVSFSLVSQIVRRQVWRHV